MDSAFQIIPVRGKESFLSAGMISSLANMATVIGIDALSLTLGNSW